MRGVVRGVDTGPLHGLAHAIPALLPGDGPTLAVGIPLAGFKDVARPVKVGDHTIAAAPMGTERSSGLRRVLGFGVQSLHWQPST